MNFDRIFAPCTRQGWLGIVQARLAAMTRLPPIRLGAVLVGSVLLLGSANAIASSVEEFNPSPHAIEIPSWFTETFLDFRDDIREAAVHDKRLMVYFGQDGCPYCKRLMQVNFTQKDIVDKTRRHFNAVAINMWGDREVTWIDGTTHSEKTFAAMLNVQFTPTLLFFDEKGRVVLRVNGYYPPNKFRVALDYVSGRNENKITFADYLQRNLGEPSSDALNNQPFLMRHPLDLSASGRRRGKPLAVIFEQRECAACDELHREGFSHPDVRGLLERLDFAQVGLFDSEKLVTPDGRTLTAREWARALRIAYTPSIVFFDDSGREVFRIDAYLRPFHLASSLDYVSSKAYRDQPSFQRYLQARTAKIQEAGGAIKLW